VQGHFETNKGGSICIKYIHVEVCIYVYMHAYFCMYICLSVCLYVST
jgi:hypothetical protein